MPILTAAMSGNLLPLRHLYRPCARPSMMRRARWGQTNEHLGQRSRGAGFLLGAVAVAGGAAFGVYHIRKPVENPLAPDQGATLNPYVIIDQTGVTIIAPRAEMGQGVHTTLAALVAEELDVDFASIRVEHGPPSAAYYNGALMHGALPVADYAMKDWQHSVVGGLGAVSKLLGLQVTGGSTSTVDAYEKMRLAGAGAREALKAVVADRLGVNRAELRTEDGAVIAPDDRRIPYADLAEEAAARPVPDVTLRPQSEWKLLGRALPRPDMRAKITGKAQYATDIQLPGMKFATVRICPHLGGGMAGFDPAPALAMPGVEQVIDMGNGVAVVARNTWAALEGARAVDITWTDSPLPADMDGMFAAIEAAFDTEPNSTLRDEGDATTLPDGAISAEYRVPFLAHSTMEPQGATAWLQDGRMTLWAGNQAPRLCVQKAAEASGLAEDAITLHTTFMGGGFGRRAETDAVAQGRPHCRRHARHAHSPDMVARGRYGA